MYPDNYRGAREGGKEFQLRFMEFVFAAHSPTFLLLKVMY